MSTAKCLSGDSICPITPRAARGGDEGDPNKIVISTQFSPDRERLLPNIYLGCFPPAILMYEAKGEDGFTTTHLQFIPHG
jgi:hypothetical protein